MSTETDIAAPLVDRMLASRRFDVFVGPQFQENRLVAAGKLDRSNIVAQAERLRPRNFIRRLTMMEPEAALANSAQRLSGRVPAWRWQLSNICA